MAAVIAPDRHRRGRRGHSGLDLTAEEKLLDVVGETGVGCIACPSPEQEMLTGRYLGGVRDGLRARSGQRAVDAGVCVRARSDEA